MARCYRQLQGSPSTLRNFQRCHAPREDSQGKLLKSGAQCARCAQLCDTDSKMCGSISVEMIHAYLLVFASLLKVHSCDLHWGILRLFSHRFSSDSIVLLEANCSRPWVLILYKSSFDKSDADLSSNLWTLDMSTLYKINQNNTGIETNRKSLTKPRLQPVSTTLAGL